MSYTDAISYINGTAAPVIGIQFTAPTQMATRQFVWCAAQYLHDMRKTQSLVTAAATGAAHPDQVEEPTAAAGTRLNSTQVDAFLCDRINFMQW